MLERSVLLAKNSLWTNVKTLRDQQCADLRDRAFALIALSQPAPRGSIRPDYTKSTTEVFLQLLEQEACSPTDQRRSIATTTGFEVARSFCLGPHVADTARMLEQRRLMWNSKKVDLSREDQDEVHRIGGLHRVIVHVVSHCTISKDEFGKLIAPLLRKNPPTRSVGHDFQYVERNAKDDAIRIRSPDGTVMALADRKTRLGDTILLLAVRTRDVEKPPVVGLIVRATDNNVYFIVGQVVFDSGVQTCRAVSLSRPCCPSRHKNCSCSRPPSSRCECGVDQELHDRPGKGFTIYMSVEDFLLFVTQDIDLQERQNGANTTLMLVRPADTVIRLETSVTSHWLSSYAKCVGQGGVFKPK